MKHKWIEKSFAYWGWYLDCICDFRATNQEDIDMHESEVKFETRMAHKLHRKTYAYLVV